MARTTHSTLAGLLLVVFVGVPAAPRCCSAANSTETVSARRPLAGGGRLVSNNSKFALGFFQGPGGGASPSSKRYLGIWFNTVPNLTTVWVANSASPIMDDAAPELAISGDGDLAVFNRATGSMIWSTNSSNGAAKNRSNSTSAVLLNSGNLVLQDASNLSETRVLWQSFDHPTDTLLPGAKLGIDKITGLNRRLVSRKSIAGPSPGAYCFEVDPAAPQLVLKLCGSSTTYWSSGTWNGQYFSAIPELSGKVPSFNLAFVDDATEEYLQFNVTDDAVVTRNIVDVTGQNKHQVWLVPSQSWLTLYTTPKQQCEVYGICGSFAVCSYDLIRLCSCMNGFSVGSVKEWKLGDHTGGCVRDTPLDCTSSNTSASAAAAGSGDKFYAMAGVMLPDKAQRMGAAGSSAECAELCLKNCTCTAYSYGGGQGCLVWRDELLGAKSPRSNGEILYLRLAASEIPSSGRSGTRKRRRVVIGVVTAAAAAAVLFVVVVAVMVWRRNRAKNGVHGGGGGLVAFRYRDLRSATKNFSEKLGEGGFGSVYKGQLRDATGIAVKRLGVGGGGGFQGEKQFRAEVRSIGIIQHVNLVRLIGFCCGGDGGRFLVYEHMPNRSLDIHLFQSGGNGDGGGVFLDWSARYEIALGVARGLCYLHESCRDRIIHCDIKPQNILLDASLRPKIADFGMAKFVGRDLSRVLTTMRGTMGYLAPEWISGTPITPKVDVYSYGMVLLELVSGRRNSAAAADDGSGSHGYFPVEASRKLLEGDVGSLLDERLLAGDDGEADLKEVERACKVACWCIQDDEADRPAMGQVVRILEGVLDPDMPPLPRLLQTMFARPPNSENSSMF